jgi:hypothetical protein
MTSVRELIESAAQLFSPEPYTRLDGGHTSLAIWRSACPTCSESFKARSPARAIEPNRRCTASCQSAARSWGQSMCSIGHCWRSPMDENGVRGGPGIPLVKGLARERARSQSADRRADRCRASTPARPSRNGGGSAPEPSRRALARVESRCGSSPATHTHHAD